MTVVPPPNWTKWYFLLFAVFQVDATDIELSNGLNIQDSVSGPSYWSEKEKRRRNAGPLPVALPPPAAKSLRSATFTGGPGEEDSSSPPRGTLLGSQPISDNLFKRSINLGAHHDVVDPVGTPEDASSPINGDTTLKQAQRWLCSEGALGCYQDQA